MAKAPEYVVGLKQRTVQASPLPAAIPQAITRNQLTEAVQKTVNQQSMSNGLAEAVGIGGGMSPFGFPGNQGSAWSTQVSEPTTIFKNLRWFLVSNMRQVLSEAYVELGLVQAICDLPVDDGIRGGVDIKSKQLDESQIEELQLSMDRDDDLDTIGQAAKWNRLYGGAGILVLTDQDPEEPLDLDAIGPDDPLEFRACDMWELSWDMQNMEGWDPSIQDSKFEFYSYYGIKVHKSRVQRLKGLTAPSFVRPRLRGWGFSVVEILVRSINQYLKGTDLGFEVLDEFKLDIYKIKNLTNTLLSDVGTQKVKERIQLANYQKNYQNAIVMDSEDEYDHKQLSFAGLGEAMSGIRMQVASDMRMPLSKLFGISATGFNSGEDDIEVYNSMVESQVRNKIKYPLLRMLEIKCQKLFGFVPDDLSIKFKPLRLLSAVDEETVKTQKYTRLLQAKQAGEISTQEFRDACNKGNLFDISLDTEEDDLTGDTEDVAAEDPDDKDDEGTDNPGANRPDSQKSKAGTNNQKVKTNSQWKEGDHPRDDDGKFGSGGGGSSDSNKTLEKELVKKHKLRGNFEIHSSGHNRTDAIAMGKAMRKEGRAAFIWHMSGPRTGPKSSYIITTSRSQANSTLALTLDKNVLMLLPKPYSFRQRLKRLIRNSAAFDRASYAADGGDEWIDDRRKYFFMNPQNVDQQLWWRGEEASREAFGQVNWKFVAWYYRKLGGKFK